jgi:ATP adenylyltransferase
MENNKIWAPWRAAFILGKREKGCIFCNRLKKKDSLKNLIMYRGETCFVILNKYPYNSGHTMVVPKRHISQLERLTVQESIEFFDLTRKTATVIKKALKPSALNLGMNLGRTAGAGIPGHLHMHIVPRWPGDTNFMPVVGKTHVISIPLEPVYEAIKAEFARL